MEEQKYAISEINRTLTLLAGVCRSKEQRGTHEDIPTIETALDAFNYTVKEFSPCLPDEVVAKIKTRQAMAEKMVSELIGSLTPNRPLRGPREAL